MSVLGKEGGMYKLLVFFGLLSALIMINCGAVEAAPQYNLACNACHGMPPLDSAIRNRTTGGFKGNHQTHQPLGAKIANCAVCHNASSYTTGHLNGKISFQANLNNSPATGQYKVGGTVISFKNQTSMPRLGVCSSVNCHFETVSPQWGGTPFSYISAAVNDCSQCHGLPPSGSGPSFAGGVAGSHSKHDAYYQGAVQCKKCHPDHLQEASKFGHASSAGNRNLLIQTKSPNDALEGSYSGSLNDYLPSQNNTFGSCSGLYCHSPGNKASGYDTPNQTPAWGSSLNCTGCHKSDATSGSYMSSGSHTSHVNYGGGFGYNKIKCLKCHAETATESMTIGNVSRHVNRQVEIAFDSTTTANNGTYNGQIAKRGAPSVKAPGTAFASCTVVYCHSTGQGLNGTWPPTYQSPVWGNYASGMCGTCHGIHGTQHSGMGLPSSITSGSHSAHLSYSFGLTELEARCAACHSYTTTGMTLGGCNSAACHNQLSEKHVNHEINIGIADLFGSTASYSGSTKPGDGYGQCFNIYCHSDGQSSPHYAQMALSWGTLPLSCTGCHGSAAAPQDGTGGTNLSWKHAAHLNPAANASIGLGNGLGCLDCHAKTVTNSTTIKDKAKHVNKFVDYSSIHGGGSSKYNSTTKLCLNIYCHSNGNPAALVYVNPAAWNSAITYGCNGCHGTSNPGTGAPDYTNGGPSTNTSNSHNKHVAGAGITDTRGCANCHVKTASQSTAGVLKSYTAVSYHLNGTPNVYFKALGGKTGTWNGSTCSNTYCHGAAASAAWGTTTSLPCNSCHAASATDAYWSSNSAHKIHWQGSTLPTSYTMAPGNNIGNSTAYMFACSSCHGKSAMHAGGPANANGAAEVFYGYTSSTMKGSYSYGTTQGTTDNGFNWTNGGTGCNTSYCHSNGQGARGLLAVSWSTTASSGTCVQCHDTKQIGSTATKLSGKHDAHLNPTTNTTLGLGNGMGCIDCHAKTVSSNTVIKDKTKHVNKFIDFSSVHGGGNSKYNASTHLCANIYCHSNGNKSSLVYVNPAAWNSATTYGCNGCHGTGSSIGAPDYTNGGEGTPTANSHDAHVYGAASTIICSDCHVKTASMTTTGRFKDYTAASYHLNGTPNVVFNKAKAGASVAWDQASGQCSNIACHGGSSANWGSTAGCLTCHSLPVANRAAIGPQFGGNSHHIQGPAVTGAHCYQCHWEANSDGTINHTYHHSGTSGAAVELVVYGNGARPTTYTLGTTAIQYTANGSRTEMAKINTHCLACHSAKNDAITPFGDGKTPKQYAWDNSSVAVRFTNMSTTPWGKYSGGNVSPKNVRTKAFSAHGNATANQGGWNTSETWPNTRNGSANVLCFDCHNSHGSTVAGMTTSYVSATVNGGILKDTTSGKGGYTTTYKPVAGGSTANHNVFNAGAALCFDCHMNATAGTTPWGYTSTFGATQQIMGYWDTAYFGAGTFGSLLRYPYKPPTNMGGHFGASSALEVGATKQIGGLCTPCHDPHGLSPMLGTNRKYAVPILKGTWLTSPFKEDAATKDNQAYKYLASPGDEDAPRPAAGTFAAYTSAIKSYHIDQNTFVSGTITQTDTQFGGLCLSCHPKTNLTNGTTHTWKSRDRIHESVKGWKTANTTVMHSYSCSKCHSPHNSFLPRLMVSNCLDYRHRGRVTNNTSAVTSFSYRGSEGSGSGAIPGSYAGGKGSGSHTGSTAKWTGWGSNPPSSNTFTCHENNDSNQLWNTVTPWTTR